LSTSNSTSSLPAPPRIPENNRREQQLNLQNTRYHRRIAPTVARSNKSRGRQEGTQLRQPRSHRSLEFEFIVSPDNGSNGPPALPKRNSRLFSELENGEMVKVVTFNEDNMDHCIQQIQKAFEHLELVDWYFYRPDAASGTLVRSKRMSRRDCSFQTFSRYFATNNHLLILVLQVDQNLCTSCRRYILVPFHPNLLFKILITNLNYTNTRICNHQPNKFNPDSQQRGVLI
jgi:hypothetical protein